MSRKIRDLLDDMWERIEMFVPEDQLEELAEELLEVADDHEVNIKESLIAEAAKAEEEEEDDDDDEEDEDEDDEEEDEDEDEDDEG